MFLHFRILGLLGIPIGEMWDLEALAEDCASDGVYEFLLTSAPLNLLDGVGSPANASRRSSAAAQRRSVGLVPDSV